MAATLSGKTLFITGGSRGIGLAIAKMAATDGANIVIAAKTATPHAKLKGTIYSAADEIEKAGGRALPIVLDVRDADAIETAVNRASQHFGGIDICINNASAISLDRTNDVDVKRFDLMHQVNVRGSFLVTRASIPHLMKSNNPHVLSLSPPLNLKPEWFASHLAYTLSKYGMSMITLGLAEEFRQDGIAFNSLWPATTIATAAVEFKLGGEEAMKRSRKPEIMADAARIILLRHSRKYTGNFALDEDILREENFENFEIYRNHPTANLEVDLFV